MIKRLLLSTLAFLIPLSAFATWSTDRDASAGYVTVTTQASVIDEAVPFFIVYLSDLPADFHTAMSDASDTDGKTIRLATSDGSTQLACYPVGINTSTDTGALFCLGTGMSASVDVDYRIYVGNAALSMESVSGGYGRNTVFAAYAAAYLPGVTLTDLTGNGRDLTAANSPGTAASSMEGITAATYNGTSQYHYNDATPAITGPDFTIETVQYITSLATFRSSVGIAASSASANIILHGYEVTPNNRFRVGIVGGSGSTSVGRASAAPTINTWHHATSKRSGATTGTTTVYMDGANSGTDSTTLVAFGAMSKTTIGAMRANTTSSYWIGNIASVFLSSSARSADYITTQYDNLNGDLYSAGAWTALDSCTSGSTGWVLLQTASQTTTADADWASTGNALVDDANATTSSVPDSGYSETLKLTNPAYGTSIPTGAIYTVSFRIKHKGTGGGGRRALDSVVQFIDDTGTQVGDNVAKTTNYWPSTTASEDYVATGLSLDGTEFTSAAGVAIKASGVDQTGTETASIYAVWIKVDWTCPSALDTTRGFFMLGGG